LLIFQVLFFFAMIALAKHMITVAANVISSNWAGNSGTVGARVAVGVGVGAVAGIAVGVDVGVGNGVGVGVTETVTTTAVD
jgi:hypothetical protein